VYSRKSDKDTAAATRLTQALWVLPAGLFFMQKGGAAYANET
jgi:hypothetical protein